VSAKERIRSAADEEGMLWGASAHTPHSELFTLFAEKAGGD
jgi:hypothetical protein